MTYDAGIVKVVNSGGQWSAERVAERLHAADVAGIQRALERLEARGTIRKINRGPLPPIYYKAPVKGEFV